MNDNNSMKTVALVCGLISVLLSVTGLIVGFFSAAGGWMAVFGIILGIMAIIISASTAKNGGSGAASGLVLGLLGLIFGVIVGVSCLICDCACGWYDAVDTASEYQDAIEDAIDYYN